MWLGWGDVCRILVRILLENGHFEDRREEKGMAVI
jgi:hypothetical protein